MWRRANANLGGAEFELGRKDGMDGLSDARNARRSDLRRMMEFPGAGRSHAVYHRPRLGHADRTVTGIYDRWQYLEEKREALCGDACSVNVSGYPARDAFVTI
jgi:hypothetical protein